MSVKVPSLAASMTPFPYSVAADETLDAALAMMLEHDIHHLPVTDGEQILGLVTDSDIALARSLVAEGATPPTIRSVHRTDVRLVPIATPLGEVVRAMGEGNQDAVVIIRQDKLAGILTYTDVCRILAEVLDELRPSPESDGVA